MYTKPNSFNQTYKIKTKSRENNKSTDKLGLSWAKLSLNWDWTLPQFSVDLLVSLDLVFILGFILGLIEKIWFGIHGSLHFKHLRRFNFVDFFCRLGLVNLVQ